MGLNKPERHAAPAGKRKRLAASVETASTSRAANAATYQASEYHCRGSSGAPRRTRVKPASPCPQDWTVKEAQEALRVAIVNGRVSELWDDEFPRYVWHVQGDTIYEARHTRGPSGTYHAYPITSREAPAGLIR